MRRDRFSSRVDELDPECLDRNLKEAFRKALASQALDPVGSALPLRDRFIAFADQLGGRTEKLTDAEIRERIDIVGALRGLLAGVCIESLEPDLVILDEFQRFSDLLHGTDEPSKLAQELFRYEGVRVLLLSATPYRMFTTAEDAGGDAHYADLVQTIGFLQHDPERTKAFQGALASYGRELTGTARMKDTRCGTRGTTSPRCCGA